MRFSVLILALVLVIPFCSISQESIEIQGKKYYSKYLFKDDFDDNKNNWKTQQNETKFRAIISNGAYNLYNKSTNKSQYIGFPTELDLNKVENFEIGVTIKILNLFGKGYSMLAFNWNKDHTKKIMHELFMPDRCQNWSLHAVGRDSQHPSPQPYLHSP